MAKINSQITSSSSMVIKATKSAPSGKKPTAKRGGDLRAK